MTNLNDSMRPKMNGDTYYIPDPRGGVYLRNNSGSFRIEGESMDKWIEKLIPVFNGRHTLEEITDGLPDPYRVRVYDIASVLYKNGYVRDVSQDLAHQLPDTVLDQYASQIEFLDHFGGSGANRFERYRQGNVLAVGSGPMLVSLVASLLESGLPKFCLLITASVPTNRQRLQELVTHARQSDPDVYIEEIMLTERAEADSWRDIVKPFDSILYVSQEGNVEELRSLHAACRKEKKVLLPAICLEQTGVSGPLVHPDFEECWESAWRRMHQAVVSKDPQQHSFSGAAGALLANVTVFEWFKWMTAVTGSEQKPALYLLNLETLEGDWHSFLPHPLVTAYAHEHGRVNRVEELGKRLEQSSGKPNREPNALFPFFSRLTSSETGIFHLWEEGDLKQLPLSQCRVQAVDPLTEGPAELLPELVCTGLTHEEARRESALAGLEAYVSRLAGRIVPGAFSTVGVGETFAEGLCRGLQSWIAEQLGKRQSEATYSVSHVHLRHIEDEHCRYYLQSLMTERGVPVIGLGESVSGFPVVWVGVGGRFYGSADLNVTLALRSALRQALSEGHHAGDVRSFQPSELSFLPPEDGMPRSLDIAAWQQSQLADELKDALQALQRNGIRITVSELEVEPFLSGESVCALGVLVQEGESP